MMTRVPGRLGGMITIAGGILLAFFVVMLACQSRYRLPIHIVWHSGSAPAGAVLHAKHASGELCSLLERALERVFPHGPQLDMGEGKVESLRQAMLDRLQERRRTHGVRILPDPRMWVYLEEAASMGAVTIEAEIVTISVPEWMSWHRSRSASSGTSGTTTMTPDVATHRFRWDSRQSRWDLINPYDRYP